MTGEIFRIPAFMQQMAEAITEISTTLDPEEMSSFIQELISAKRVYVAGAGRSGFIAKAFGMRLMHLGVDAYVVGETITPALHGEDILVVISGSGETHSMVLICDTVKSLGGKVCLVTASPDSRMSRMADCVVNLGDLTGYYRKDRDTFEVRQLTGEYRSVASAFAPLGTLFETLALVFTDAVISSLLEARKAGILSMQDRLTNME